MAIDRFEQLKVYQEGFEAAMQIFERSQQWPQEERFALTDQIRRSSRSVCANSAEAWRKRRYEKHFISKRSDAAAEAAETRVWLRFAHRGGHLADADFEKLDQTYNYMCGGLVRMMRNPQKWRLPSHQIGEDAVDYKLAP